MPTYAFPPYVLAAQDGDNSVTIRDGIIEEAETVFYDDGARIIDDPDHYTHYLSQKINRYRGAKISVF